MATSVRDLLYARIQTNSQRNERSDAFHLALVIEGGGMRGVVSGGMVSAVEKLGILHCFDSIHGSSAGACAGAYLIAGQAQVGTSIYYEDINNSKFISVPRGLLGGAAMSADYLVDHVMRVPKPLNVQAILSQPDVLNIVTTSVFDAKAVIFNRWASKEAFFETLRASILIPMIAGKAVEIDGRAYVDGGVVQQIAVDSALKGGATHLLVFMTRTIDELERRSPPLTHFIERTLLRHRYGNPIADAYEARAGRINKTIDAIRSNAVAQRVQSDWVVRPATGTKIGRLTKDGGMLRSAAADGELAVRNFVKNLGSEKP